MLSTSLTTRLEQVWVAKARGLTPARNTLSTLSGSNYGFLLQNQLALFKIPSFKILQICSTKKEMNTQNSENDNT